MAMSFNVGENVAVGFQRMRGSGRSFPVTTNLERSLIIIVAIAVTISVGLIISLVNIKKSTKESLTELKMKGDNICLSASCITEASNLMKSMDLSVDPCKDFYTFVCGNWIKNHYLVSSLETQFTQLSRTILLRVKEILDDLVFQKNLPKNKQKTRDFYKACMDSAHRKVVGAEELLSDLKKFGGWPLIEEDWNPNFDWADLMIQLFKNGYTINMLFNIKVNVDMKNTSRSLITVSEPSLGLIESEYYILPDEDTLNAYKEVIFRLAQYLKPDIDKEKAMKDIKEAFEIENKLAQLSKGIDKKNLGYYYEETLGKLEASFPKLSKGVNTRNQGHYYVETLGKLEASFPKIQWRKLLQNLLPPGTELNSEEPIIFTSPTLLKALNSLFEEKMNNTDGKRILANYMFYRVVFNAANHLSKKFYNLILNLFQEDAAAQSWNICQRVTIALFPMPLAASYVAKYMDNRTKERLGIMFEDMRSSLMSNIRNSKWLDDETKTYALFKARKMEAAIAYEDEIMHNDNLDSYYKDVNITEDHFGNVKHMMAFRLRQNMEGLHEKRIRFKWTDVNNLLTANAYYLPTENSIIIPVGVLQETIFAAKRPNYINYGSLGMIVGHELTHAFDSMGSLYDAEGSQRMWWSNKSWKEFKERIKCFQEQYSSYYFRKIANSKVDGLRTLGENIADNGGLKTAYYAYKALLERTGSEKSLPGLPYNEKQMFWISFASVWCRKQTVESIQYTISHSVHTPAQLRVIGTLSNMREFSEDFSCEPDTPMNPRSKCFLWE